MLQVLTQFLHGLDSSDSLAESFTTLTDAVEALGYDGVLYTAIPQFPTVPTTTHALLTSSGWNANYLRHYNESNWHKDDFVLEKVLQGSLEPINWTYELKSGQLTNRQNDIIETAQQEYSMRNVITIPTQGDRKLIAGATIISEQKDAFFNKLNKDNFRDLRIVIQTFHDHVFKRKGYRKNFYLPILETFSEAEIKLMLFVVSGQQLKTSQEACGISPTRAGNILSGLYKRLAIRNSTEFGHIVGSHDLLELIH